jgi:hypothetical protein
MLEPMPVRGAFMRTLILAVSLAVPVSLVQAEEPAAALPTLSGRWTLDKEKSDDARQKIPEAGGMGGGRGGMHGGRGGPGGGGAGGPGGGGYGGGGGRRGGGGMGGPGGPAGPGGGFGEAMRSVSEAPPGLTITETPEEITIIEEDGRFRALHPDKKEYKGTSGEKIVTRREGAQIVVETKGERGPKLVETFEPGAEELIANVRIEGGRGQPVTIRRVYRRVASP